MFLFFHIVAAQTKFDSFVEFVAQNICLFYVFLILGTKLSTTTDHRIQMSWSSEKETLYKWWRNVMMAGL